MVDQKAQNGTYLPDTSKSTMGLLGFFVATEPPPFELKSNWVTPCIKNSRVKYKSKGWTLYFRDLTKWHIQTGFSINLFLISGPVRRETSILSPTTTSMWCDGPWFKSLWLRLLLAFKCTSCDSCSTPKRANQEPKTKAKGARAESIGDFKEPWKLK